MKQSTLILTAVVIGITVSSRGYSQEKGKQNSDSTYTIVDQTARIPNKIESLYAYIGENVKYPKQARKKGVEGKVFIEFVVNKSGKMEEFKVLKGIGAGCDVEAVRVLAQYPDKWIPGVHKGNVVRQKMVIPIQFVLGEDENNKKDEKS